ncbi:MAG: ABC transporter substrate-binding protein [Clostridia bacterium]|nr:ABC transporter substrate-binding protein [Clostridia bacterium]
MKKILALLLCLAMVCGLAACGGSSAPSSGGNDASAPAEKEPFVMRVAFDFDNYDPAYVTSTPDMLIAQNVYSKLIKYDRTKGEFYGDLAESWDISEDGTVYTFHLRKDAKFQDGTPVKASDVVYSVTRVNEIGYQTVFAFCGLTNYEATDDNTVAFTLAAPYAAFLDCLTGNFFIVSEAYIEGGKDPAVEPMGSGAYKFESITSGYEVVLSANEDYYLGAPEVKEVHLRVLSDDSATTAAFETGDLSYGVVPFTTYDSLKDREDLYVFEGYPTLSLPLVVNNNVGPLADARVRLALNYAVDREALIENSLEGFGEPAYYWLETHVTGMPDYAKIFEHDVEKAKSLMAEAGYADGFDLKVLITEENKEDAVVLQSQLKEIGINCDIQEGDAGALVGAIFAGDYEAAIVSLGVGSFIDIWTSFLETGGVYNLAGYSNPEVDALLQEARGTMDDAKAAELYTKVFDIYMEDAPYVGLYQYGELHGLNTKKFKAKAELERDELFDITTIGYAD